MFDLSRSRRPHRAGEWSESRAVTFIVTLAASRSVTLAAARAGMSRKAAYALKSRNAAFAAAWSAALAAGTEGRLRRPAPKAIQGNKVREVRDPWIGRRQSNRPTALPSRLFDAEMRDQFFLDVANRAGDLWPPSLAATCSLA